MERNVVNCLLLLNTSTRSDIHDFISHFIIWNKWCCCCSVTQSCPTLCNPMDYSTPGLPVPHHLLKFAQVHVHCISDAIQPSHPLMSSSPSALNLSQQQELFQWVGCSHQVTKILELQLQHQSFQWVFRVDLLYDWLVWSPCCSREQVLLFKTLKSFIQHHSSKASFLWFSEFSHLHRWHWKDHSLDYMDLFLAKWSLCFLTQFRFVIAFLPRSSHLLISWLQSPSAVILDQEEEICHCFHIFPFYLPWSDQTGCRDLSFF